MGIKAGWSTPFWHVQEIERSIQFYERLGFTLVDTDRCAPLGWARLHCDGGAIMFVRAEEPVEEKIRQSTILYMYTPDLPGLRQQLIADGIAVPEIVYPGYLPSGECKVKDPDGHTVMIAHWGKAEQEAWERRIGGKG